MLWRGSLLFTHLQSTFVDCFSAASTSNAYDPDKPIMTALGFLGKLPGGKSLSLPLYIAPFHSGKVGESSSVHD